jgi:gliding motility-associated protein GldL
MSQEKAKTKEKAKGKEGESFLQSKAFKSMMVKLYGIGAAVVIVGALFKIMHWKGAGTMLTMGLSTEALIFFVSAFDPQKHEVDWTRVYPELAGEEPPEGFTKKSVSEEVAKMLQEAKLDQATVNKLSEGMHNLIGTVGSLKDITNAAVATDEFTKKINMVTENVTRINDSYAKSAEALSSLTESSASTKDYFAQMKSAAMHLASLNNIYEMEMANANKHSEAMTKYQGNLTKTIQNLVDAEAATTELKEGFVKLNKNLASLNSVYGNMLNAMSTRI